MLRISHYFLSKRICSSFLSAIRHYSSKETTPPESIARPVEFQDNFIKELVNEELITIPDFITEEEEKNLMDEIDPILTQSRYQTAHWDDVN